ncbi:uncharacterized protein [Apostichopus japonicus]|uniref:uncharacterized protein n=1 Tax=Stichopus japonicus TaxID=307972 RepID=UPI003AB44427
MAPFMESSQRSFHIMCLYSYDTVDTLAKLATNTVDAKTTIPIDSSEESVETAERSIVPAFRFIDPCPIRHEFSGIVYGVTIKNDFVLVLWPQTFHKAICTPGNDFPKCSGNCVQQYKYENALVFSQCSIRWDLIKVESGCCCHQYQRNSITYLADATI